MLTNLPSDGTRVRPRSRRQEQILDALEVLISTEGIDGLTIGSLAARLSCSRSTLYAIAPSKEELFLVVEERLLDRIQTRALACAAQQSEPSARLESYLAGALEVIQDVGTPFVAEIHAYAPARRLLDEFQRTVVMQIREMVESGIAEGVFQPVNAHLAAELLDAAASRIQDPRVLTEAEVTPAQAISDVVQVVTRGLLKRSH